jgi:phosphoribosylformylglycinamidine (FGAM) synthase-like enzyme
MWQFSQTIDGITKACEELETPITGGNVSFYNETLGEGIYPTPVMGVVGIIEDVHKAIGPDFREAGRALIMLRGSEPGDASDVEAEFGSSEYAKEVLGHVWGFPPSLELDKESLLQKGIVEMIGLGLLDSAKDCSEGGVAVTLAECGFARGVGARVNLSSDGLVPEFVLFGEDASRILISCDPTNVGRIKELAVKYALSAEVIGETVQDKFEIRVAGVVAASADVSELHDAWAGALKKALHVETEERLVPAALQKS